jgi:hypothetical protein
MTPSSPHSSKSGTAERSSMASDIVRETDQLWTGPSGLADQSIRAIRSAQSPPPFKKGGTFSDVWSSVTMTGYPITPIGTMHPKKMAPAFTGAFVL